MMKTMGRAIENKNGFTFIELLLVMVISTIIAGAIYTAYRSQQDSFLAQDQIAEMQQNLRAALDLMSADIRMAGYDPTKSANSSIVAASVGQFQMTRDITGGHTDGDDNDSDTRIDAADNDEALYGDGDVTDADENVTYRLSDDNNAPFGLADNFNSDLERRDGAAGPWLPIAENIDALEFFYTLDTGTTTLAPADPADIRAVQITILARAGDPDQNFDHQATYTTPGGQNWTPPNDNFRRRMITLTVQARNMGF